MTTTPADDAASILGPITPIHCPLTGCHWSCHGVPDKYADSRARIVREHLAAEHAPEDAEHALATARRVVGETTTDTVAQPDGLRERIRRAICEASGFTWLPDELMEPDEYGEHADAVLAVLPAPADRAAVLREAADAIVAENDRQMWASKPGQHWAADHLHRLADEAQQPTGAENDALTDCATEYRVPVPENGGEQLLVRRQSVAQGVGWAVSVMARGGGRAWTTEGWQESISALSVDRLFCWPDACTAVDEARRALTAPAVTEEPTP